MNPARRPPRNVQVLQRWVGDLAREQGIAPGRVQRWISFMVVAGLLDHVRDKEGDPLFLLKGGAAMELRLGLRARATKDYDTAYREAIDGMLGRLDAALRHGFGDFTATRTEPESIAGTATQRLDIKLSYRGRSWGTVQLEVAATEGETGREIDRVPGVPLDALGITGPVHVPCISIRYQIAQKLHACTEVPSGGRQNDRFRDLIDLLLLADLVESDEWPRVRAACEEISALRAKQPWPPTVTVFDIWAGPYRALAAELSFPLIEVEEAADAVRAMIERIAAGS
ncbi:MAG: nucleotidyl transferase AbiEii/AbiGii toxin family protein [Acidobacteria bacterium]|nr:nucleotidyl transferase AbiEii/AbiGii toxin family protein [Acidobacteriota bacterium]